MLEVVQPVFRNMGRESHRHFQVKILYLSQQEYREDDPRPHGLGASGFSTGQIQIATQFNIIKFTNIIIIIM